MDSAARLTPERGRLVAASVLIGSLSFFAFPCSGQVVRGIVRDAIDVSPMVGVDVFLLAANDSVVGRAVTADSGRFVIRSAVVGLYRIRASRAGYAELTTDAFELFQGHDAFVPVDLTPIAGSLQPIGVIAERRKERLERLGFFRRMEMGFGYFRTAEDIAEIRPTHADQLFHGMPGIRVLPNGSVVTWARGCGVRVAVDGMVISGSWRDAVHFSAIEAIEVYPRPAGVPPWMPPSPCGALIIWTRE